MTSRGPNHTDFSWRRIQELIGAPATDSRVRALFANVGSKLEELWIDDRVGIYSMPPRDQQPCPQKEIDLSPSYRVSLGFRHAGLVLGAAAVPPTTFVFNAVTYHLEHEDGMVPFAAALPAGIRPTDDVDAIIKKVGRQPPTFELEPGDDSGYMMWDDQNPIVHVLFRERDKRPLRVNVFLAPNGDGV